MVIGNSRFVIVYLLLILALLYLHLHTDVAVPIKRSFTEFPLREGQWVMISQATLSNSIMKVLRPADYLMREYRGPDGEKISLYIGYHSGGKESGEIHSPKHCLPGSGWYRIAERTMQVNVGGRVLRFVRAVYQKDENKEMLLYWYQIKGRTLSNEYALKAHEILNSALYRRRDSAFVRISLPLEGEEEAVFRRGMRFIRDFYPRIAEFLPE
ncbi:MAG: exosortase C-terminal domain/associated protein EpsI [Nitrospirota bacterium]